MSDQDYDVYERDKKFAGLTLTARVTALNLSKADRREIAADLRSFPVFTTCSDADIEALASICEPFAVPANWAIISESTPADACFAIREGTVRILRGGVVIAEASRGELIGEMAVVTGQLRSATVTSTTRVRGVRIDNNSLAAAMAVHPGIDAALRLLVSDRIARRHPSDVPG